MRKLSSTLLILTCLAFSACASDKKLVANLTASYIYHEQAYVWKCVEPQPQIVPQPACQKYQRLLSDAKRQVTLANDVYKVGALPKDQKKVLLSLKTALELMP